MIKYFCDKCQKQISSSVDRFVVRITTGENKRMERHYCGGCFSEFKKMFDTFNGSDDKTPAYHEVASQGRTNAFLIMKLMIMLYRNTLSQSGISKYLGIPMSTLVSYKKKYYDKMAEARVFMCDDYSKSDKFIQYDILLTILSSKGKTVEDAQLEFDPSRKELAVRTIQALMCFFTNIINLDWFHSVDEVEATLRKYRVDIAEEFKNEIENR